MNHSILTSVYKTRFSILLLILSFTISSCSGYETNQNQSLSQQSIVGPAPNTPLPPSPPAPAPPSTKTFVYIQADLTQQCVSTSTSRSDGATAVQNICGHSANLLFEKIDLGNSQFKLQVRDSNLCLQIPDSSLDLNAVSTLGLCLPNASNQTFSLAILNGREQLKVQHSGQCLNISDAVDATAPAGATLEQWRCGDYSNQFFSLSTVLPTTPAPTPAPTPTPAPPPPPPPEPSIPSSSDFSNWKEIAIRDMRAPDGSYALNEDKILHRNYNSPSSQFYRASLTMGRYGTPAAFTETNPDYRAELSWIPASDPIRSSTATALNIWNHVYLSDTFGPFHAKGYKGNTRVKTWGYQMWIRTKSAGWKRYQGPTPTTGGEVWSPNFKLLGSGSFYDSRKEGADAVSVRPYPALGLTSLSSSFGIESYWMPHSYTKAVSVNANDVLDILIFAYSQLVLDTPVEQGGVDDREYARFLFSLGSDWYYSQKLTVYPGVGTSRHKFVTKEPKIHFMHTMTESEFKANPPPLDGVIK